MSIIRIDQNVEEKNLKKTFNIFLNDSILEKENEIRSVAKIVDAKYFTCPRDFFFFGIGMCMGSVCVKRSTFSTKEKPYVFKETERAKSP